MAEQSMVTTVDNPYDPFTQYDEWFEYDEAAGYHTCSLLARVANTSDEMSEADQDAAMDAAVNEVVTENTLGIFRKVTKNIE